ncbi:PREDICTED: endothelin-converting enzyme 1-like [Acropora digitifera]|uniref:endothelin-converting enzyme 1-like n=1 Tax=Acropora digitifera TaxID=70779 RepID=UPI00077AF5AE|nr:PREDICTED: endothelin-converting enzyme 1-like [Acropora digitifera]
MSTIVGPKLDDEVELVGDGASGVMFRIRRFCCGSRIRTWVSFSLAFLVVIGITVAVSIILTRPKICETALCYNISREIASQLDESVDPCNDFYSYACGGFFKTHKLTTNESEISALMILNSENLEVLRHALENVSRYSESSAIRKTKKFYSSCINTAAIDERSVTPLKDLIEKYGGWSVTGKGLNYGWSVEEKMGQVLRDLNVQTLLSVDVLPDIFDSSRNIIRFGMSSLGLSATYFNSHDDNSAKIRNAYKTYMTTIAVLLGGEYRTSEKKMSRIFEFERSLANIINKNKTFYSEDLVETVKQYHESGVSSESWDSTIKEFCKQSSFRGDSVVMDYIMWRVVDSYVQAMPKAFFAAKRKYQVEIYGPQESERWSYCLSVMSKYMDMGVGRLFVDVAFDDSSKNTVKDMTTRIRKAFTDNLESKTWMDDETREKAKEKANAIGEDVGYPSYIKDDKKLDTHYSMLTIADGLFENLVAAKKMLIQKKLGVLRVKVNKEEWLMGPASVNAYYSPMQNRIVILAGIIRSPLYKKIYPKYLNYGSLAMVIGHEITHGFDNSGRLFDKNGNYRNWWSTSSTNAFRSKAQCLIKQYGSYEVYGKYINGGQTLNENIADNGGIKLAYDAYQSWVDDNEMEGQLPDLGLSVDQLFFIGFATPWCKVSNKAAALYQLKFDVHSYNKYRVIGSLSNFKRFSKAFGCSSGDRMDPYPKCSVW